jgi:hypothetical protein
MDVCDSKGSRIGSVARVYRYDAGDTGTPDGAALATAREEILEVKTGPFGLGTQFYVPLGSIHEVVGESIFLSAGGLESDMSRFKTKPPYLDTLH